MKISNPVILSVMAALSVFSSPLSAQTVPADPGLRVEKGTNGPELVVNSISNTGAVFVYGGSSLSNLIARPSLLWQTNAPSSLFRLPLIADSQGFYYGLYWAGESTDDFGDPENYPSESAPDKILFA